MKKLTVSLLTMSAIALMITSVLTITSVYANGGNGGDLPGLSPGFWKHNLKVYLGGPGRYSVPHEGELRIDAAILDLYLLRMGDVDPEDAYAALTARGPGSDMIRLAMANAFNAAAGYTDY